MIFEVYLHACLLFTTLVYTYYLNPNDYVGGGVASW